MRQQQFSPADMPRLQSPPWHQSLVQHGDPSSTSSTGTAQEVAQPLRPKGAAHPAHSISARASRPRPNRTLILDEIAITVLICEGAPKRRRARCLLQLSSALGRNFCATGRVYADNVATTPACTLQAMADRTVERQSAKIFLRAAESLAEKERKPALLGAIAAKRGESSRAPRLRRRLRMRRRRPRKMR